MLMDGEREEDGDQGEGGETVEEEIETNTMGLQKENRDVVREIVALIEYVAQLANYRKTQKKECCNLLRRLKLLLPLMEEIRDLDTPIPDEAVVLLLNFKKVVLMARKLLKTCNDGSKIYLALESEAFMIRFQAVYEKLTQALDGLPYDELGTSDEVREQVELMSEQLRRAKKRKDTQDIEFAVDMMVAFSKTDQANADSAILERLANKLELQTVEDLKIETEAVRNLVIERGGQISESSQQIIDILNKFKGNLGMEISHILDDPVMTKMQHKSGSSAIPHEFLCPITLEIMTDPVIIASGQTYERESIRQWFDSNHRTCPKTGQTLAHLSLAPNYALKNLIVQWCEKNNFKLPQKEQPDIPSCSESPSDERREEISSLVENLSSNQLEVQRRAVKQIRMLSKENPENRVLIAEGGAIPPLVQLLSYPDSKIEEHAVTALLNLSIDEANKKLISREGAIPAIIEVLQNGSTEARENSAAALFSLSMLDENKVTVGLSNGIPPLIDLLQNGTMRGRKDAATALFNLSLNSANKGRAIDAGIVPPLLKLLKDKNLGMVDEALSIFLLLASHHEGRQEIGQPSFVETLVDFIREGTPKNRECATSVLLELGSNNSSFVLTALQLGVYEHLTEITRTGTNRAQRKANALLQLMSKLEQIP